MLLSPTEKLAGLGVVLFLIVVVTWSLTVAIAALQGGTVSLVSFGAAILLVLAVLATITLLARSHLRRSRRSRAPLGMATKAEVKAQSGAKRARAKAAHLRPSLAEKVAGAPLDEIALYLGDAVGGIAMYATLEDQGVVTGKTGAGKEIYFVVRMALSAPGPVVVTTTRAGVLDVIAAKRSEKGRVWVFDPLNLAHWPDKMVWDPIDGAEKDTVARARGRAFVAALGTRDGRGNDEFFKETSGAAIQYMVHAAALARHAGEALTIRDVAGWAMRLDNGAELPRRIIERSCHPRAEKLWAEMLKSVATGADDTVASTRVTLRGALDAISSGSVLNVLVPRKGASTFSPREFVQSRDTLVLIADANALTNVAPLTTMLLQEVWDVAKEVARDKPNGRLDPPMRIVGDEICNVAPVEKLPEMTTDARGYGIQIVTFIQAGAQLVARYGRERAETLLAQAGFEILLPGSKDWDTLDRYSKLLGSVDVAESTISTSSEGSRQSASYSMRDHRVLRPEEVRKLSGDGSALLVPAIGEAVMLELTPWFKAPDGDELSEDARRTGDHRAAQALLEAEAEKARGQ
ncbi:MAG: type IV secretory system conjugative DNA transfer family protein [Micrococcus sp.]|nr:type IV secretory system conjugative DNA transfer family protein [Micrococcus sp.]